MFLKMYLCNLFSFDRGKRTDISISLHFKGNDRVFCERSNDIEIKSSYLSGNV